VQKGAVETGMVVIWKVKKEDIVDNMALLETGPDKLLSVAQKRLDRMNKNKKKKKKPSSNLNSNDHF